MILLIVAALLSIFTDNPTEVIPSAKAEADCSSLKVITTKSGSLFSITKFSLSEVKGSTLFSTSLSGCFAVSNAASFLPLINIISPVPSYATETLTPAVTACSNFNSSTEPSS